MNCFHCGKPASGPYVAHIKGADATFVIHAECLPAVSDQLAQARWDISLKPPSGCSLKSFVISEVQKIGISYQGVYNRIMRNRKKWYPNIQLTRINKRVVFVTEKPV